MNQKYDATLTQYLPHDSNGNLTISGGITPDNANNTLTKPPNKDITKLIDTIQSEILYRSNNPLDLR